MASSAQHINEVNAMQNDKAAHEAQVGEDEPQQEIVEVFVRQTTEEQGLSATASAEGFPKGHKLHGFRQVTCNNEQRAILQKFVEQPVGGPEVMIRKYEGDFKIIAKVTRVTPLSHQSARASPSTEGSSISQSN